MQLSRSLRFSSGKKFTLLTVFILLISFLAPVLIGMLVIRVFYPNSLVTDINSEEIFSESLVVNSPKEMLRVKGSSDFEPKSEEDFILFAWLKIKFLTPGANRSIFLSKYTTGGRTGIGYSMALDKAGGQYQVSVFWSDDRNKGRWYEFSKFNLLPKEWVMLALSLEEGRFLGLHAVFVSDGVISKPLLLGGYDLGRAVLPRTDADLLFGASTQAPFKGRIGPIGVVSSGSFPEDLKDLIGRVGLGRSDLPNWLGGENVKLWISNGREDSARNNHSVEWLGEQRKREKQHKR